MAFEGHSGREAADRLRGLALRAEALDDPDALWVHDLVGSEVVTVGGDVVGTCVAVVANPRPTCSSSTAGPWYRSRSWSSEGPGSVIVDPPEGLFEP